MMGMISNLFLTIILELTTICEEEKEVEGRGREGREKEEGKKSEDGEEEGDGGEYKML